MEQVSSKTIHVLLLLLFCWQTAAMAQDEYATKEVVVGTASETQTIMPLATGEGCSMFETVFSPMIDLPVCEGEKLCGISFMGYNRGAEQQRRVTVWLLQEASDRLANRFTPTSYMGKVFDGDCTIMHGGTAEKPETILCIDFDEPYTYNAFRPIRIVIGCTDGQAGNPVSFIADRSYGKTSLFVAGDDESAFDTPERMPYRPLTTFKVDTPVRYVSGMVTDGNGKGVAGAMVDFRLHWFQDTYDYTATTDADGSYSLRLEEGNKDYCIYVSCPGYTSYEDESYVTVMDNPTKNFTLYSSVTYPAGKRSTIVLPKAPDASVGRYYAFVGNEGSRFIFNRVTSPQANVPYVLFAERDYVVDLTGMDLATAQAGTSGGDEARFVGCYSNGIYAVINSNIHRSLDEQSNTGEAMHAYLAYHFMLDNNFTLVFNDDDTGISDASAAETADGGAVFDMQGRRLTGQPRRGLYIRDGRKHVAR